MDPDKRIAVAHEYAWNWFSYHAGQRLTAFNFFLVFLGFLTVAFSKAVEEQWRWPGFAFALFGVLVSVAFLLLDLRNEELVWIGRDALASLDPVLHMPIRVADSSRYYLGMARFHRGPWEQMDDDQRRRYLDRWRPWTQHRRWLRVILIVAGAGFLSAAVWAGSGYKGLPARSGVVRTKETCSQTENSRPTGGQMQNRQTTRTMICTRTSS